MFIFVVLEQCLDILKNGLAGTGKYFFPCTIYIFSIFLYSILRFTHFVFILLFSFDFLSFFISNLFDLFCLVSLNLSKFWLTQIWLVAINNLERTVMHSMVLFLHATVRPQLSRGKVKRGGSPRFQVSLPKSAGNVRSGTNSFSSFRILGRGCNLREVALYLQITFITINRSIYKRNVTIGWLLQLITFFNRKLIAFFYY